MNAKQAKELRRMARTATLVDGKPDIKLSDENAGFIMSIAVMYKIPPSKVLNDMVIPIAVHLSRGLFLQEQLGMMMNVPAPPVAGTGPGNEAEKAEAAGEALAEKTTESGLVIP